MTPHAVRDVIPHAVRDRTPDGMATDAGMAPDAGYRAWDAPCPSAEEPSSGRDARTAVWGP